jgi:SSS family transporter
MGFTLLDSLIVVAYLVGVTAVGIIAAGRQTSARDYFLGKKSIPWWAVCFAIVATETSTLTFISIPGLAYATNLNFLQLTFGYLVGRIAVSYLLLPAYATGELVTAYQLLAQRFGPRMRNTVSITFMVTRILADGVRLYATAIPLALILSGLPDFQSIPVDKIYGLAIPILAVITLTYTYTGGVRAVIWTDVVQMFIYLLGAIGTIIVILGNTQAGDWILDPAKLSVLRTGFDLSMTEFFATPYTLMAGLLGGAFLSMASHGTDQIIVQRLLTVESLRGSRRALIGSGIIVVIQMGLFLFLGILLYGFYGGASLQELGLGRADEIFPKFIIQHLPTGLSGLIIAGLLAAAMSTLSGSINSLASSAVHDIYLPLRGNSGTAEHELRLSRITSLLACVLLVGVALFFVANTSTFLVELALSIASVTYGGMLGSFLLGLLKSRPAERDALIGFFAGIAVMVFLFLNAKIAWTWFTLIGTSATVLVGYLSSVISSRHVHSDG